MRRTRCFGRAGPGPVASSRFPWRRGPGSAVNGAVAVVTGAGGQIGRCLMADLEAGGAAVVGLDLPGATPEGDDRRVACDITDEARVREAFAAVRARYGRLDLLIHCAGLSAIGRFGDHDLETHRRVLEVTHLGAVACTLAALPDLRRSHGRVVIIGSVAGFAPVLGGRPMSRPSTRSLACSRLCALSWAPTESR